MKMYLLTFTDEINSSNSSLHVSEDTEVVGYGEDPEKLMEKITSTDEMKVVWEKDINWEGNWFGTCYYGDEVEEYQYFQITDLSNVG